MGCVIADLLTTVEKVLGPFVGSSIFLALQHITSSSAVGQTCMLFIQYTLPTEHSIVDIATQWLLLLFNTWTNSCFSGCCLNLVLDTTTVEWSPPTVGYFCFSRNCHADTTRSFIHSPDWISHISSKRRSSLPMLTHTTDSWVLTSVVPRSEMEIEGKCTSRSWFEQAFVWDDILVSTSSAALYKDKFL